jgi:CubicO group peptidase (beta-lactamase class C family)
VGQTDDWPPGINTSILGRVIEVASGQPFGEFLRSRIFEPLDMPDSGFSVPAEKRDRLARIHHLEDGKLVPVEATFASWPEEGRGPELSPEARPGAPPPAPGGR